MEIVVEYVLIDNIVINFLILYLSALLLRINRKKRRMFCGASFGAVFSLITPLLSFPLYFEIFYKLLLGLIICRIGLKPTGLKQNVIFFLTFLLMTAGLGGVCFGIVFLFGGEINSQFITFYTMEIPVGFVLLVCLLASLLIAKTFKFVKKRKVLGKFVFLAEIENKNKFVKFDVFLDSGNTLVDPILQKPVLIAELCIFSKLFEIPFEKIITKKISSEDLDGAHYIDFGAIGGGGQMLVVEVEKLTLIFENIKKEFKNVPIGLSFSKFEKCFDCSAIIGTEFAKEFL